ncbi:MAG: exonuclease SbcCD subunit D [Candidatus Acetothermia bacterium]
MKFLLTGDVHISEDHPERLKAFEWIISQADRLNIDGVLVSGDLFDSNSDFRRLRGEFTGVVEEVLGNLPLIIVPGNHDSALSSGVYLGGGVRVLDGDDSTYVFTGGGSKVTAYGLPYLQGRSSTAFLRELGRDGLATPSILLAHGSLIYPGREYIYSGISRQGGERDFLIYPEELPEEGFNAVILGHWHRYDHFVEGGRHFLYTGSPLPVAKSDLSRKFYEVLHVTGEGEVSLDKYPVGAPGSYYFRQERFFVLPDEGDYGAGRLRERLEGLDGGRRCWLMVVVDGFLGAGDERAVKSSLEEVVDGYRDRYYDVELDWKPVGVETLDRPLVSKFMGEVNSVADPEVRQLYERVIGDDIPSGEGGFDVEPPPDAVRRRALKKTLRIMADRLSE